MSINRAGTGPPDGTLHGKSPTQVPASAAEFVFLKPTDTRNQDQGSDTNGTVDLAVARRFPSEALIANKTFRDGSGPLAVSLA